jgi:hypothetical protein
VALHDLHFFYLGNESAPIKKSYGSLCVLSCCSLRTMAAITRHDGFSIQTVETKYNNLFKLHQGVYGIMLLIEDVENPKAEILRFLKKLVEIIKIDLDAEKSRIGVEFYLLDMNEISVLIPFQKPKYLSATYLYTKLGIIIEHHKAKLAKRKIIMTVQHCTQQ